MSEPQPGIYRHYKGDTYRVITIATHTETNERLVMYRCMETGEGNQLWARPVSMWNELVDGVPRFVRQERT